MSIRKERVAEQILAFLGAEIRTLKDPRAGFVTLTDVSLSKDLKRAHVFWTKIPHVSGENLPEDGLAYPSESEIVEVNKMLVQSSGYLKKKIGQELRLRNTPSLVFKYDESLKRADRLDSLLREAKQDS